MSKTEGQVESTKKKNFFKGSIKKKKYILASG